MQSPQSVSSSRIPSFSPIAAGSVPSTAISKLPDGCSTCQDIVKQLLDDLISAAALQAAGEQQQPDTDTALVAKLIVDDSSRATGARRSAITALREGIDARCDEPASIEAMEALGGTADDLLVPSPFHVVPQQQKGTTLQELTDFATESLEVEGPADSWLRASGDLPAPPSATRTAPVAERTVSAAVTASEAPGNLALKLHGPSWDDYVCDMGSKLHTTADPVPLAPAARWGAAAKSAAALHTAPAALNVAAATSSSSSLQGSPHSSQRTAPITSSNIQAAASRSSSKGSYAASSPRTAGAAAAGNSKPSGGYAIARTPVRNSPRSPTPSGLPGVSVSPRSPGSASMIPAPLRTRIPQQQSPQPQQQQQLQQAEGSPAGLNRSTSLSRSGSSRIPSALSPQPQQQQHASAAAQASAGADSAGLGAGLDVLLSGTRRRSSSDNGSSTSSRRESMGGAAPRDEAAAAWMSSLRSGAPSNTGSRKAISRSSSAAATPPLSTRTSSRQLHSTRSARIPTLGLDPVTAPSAGAVTPPVGIKSSRSIRTTPRSSVDGSANKHAQFSLRRSGSLRSSYESPTAAAAHIGGAHMLSPPAGAAPLPLALGAAAAELPGGSGTSNNAVTAAGAAEAGAHTRVLSSSSSNGAAVLRQRSTSDSETWLMPCAASTGGTGSLTSMGGGSELLSSDQEIMADPTAVRLFIELNEEIEAEGRAAMAAAAEAASAAKSAHAALAPAAGAAATGAGSVAAAVVGAVGAAGSGASGVQQGLQVTRLVSSGEVPGQQLPRDSADELQPAGEASWGSAGQDNRQSVSPESQVAAERSTQPEAAAAAAAEGGGAAPVAVDGVRMSGSEDTRNMSAGGVDPAAAAAAAAPAGKASVGKGASVATTGVVNVLAKGPALQQQQQQQASSQSGSSMHDDLDGVEDQPSCGCKCVIM